MTLRGCPGTRSMSLRSLSVNGAPRRDRQSALGGTPGRAAKSRGREFLRIAHDRCGPTRTATLSRASSTAVHARSVPGRMVIRFDVWTISRRLVAGRQPHRLLVEPLGQARLVCQERRQRRGRRASLRDRHRPGGPETHRSRRCRGSMPAIGVNQRRDPGANLVADSPDLLDRLAFGILEWPIVAL